MCNNSCPSINVCSSALISRSSITGSCSSLSHIAATVEAIPNGTLSPDLRSIKAEGVACCFRWRAKSAWRWRAVGGSAKKACSRKRVESNMAKSQRFNYEGKIITCEPNAGCSLWSSQNELQRVETAHVPRPKIELNRSLFILAWTNASSLFISQTVILHVSEPLIRIIFSLQHRVPVRRCEQANLRQETTAYGIDNRHNRQPATVTTRSINQLTEQNEINNLYCSTDFVILFLLGGLLWLF